MQSSTFDNFVTFVVNNQDQQVLPPTDIHEPPTLLTSGPVVVYFKLHKLFFYHRLYIPVYYTHILTLFDESSRRRTNLWSAQIILRFGFRWKRGGNNSFRLC
jgi:hypothetical protein